MNISILNSCVGCGACSIINPAVFDIFNNKAVVNPTNIYSTEDLCIDAALSCPVNAISIDDY